MGRGVRGLLQGVPLLRSNSHALEDAGEIAPASDQRDVLRWPWLEQAARALAYVMTVVVVGLALVAGLGFVGYRTLIIETTALAPDVRQWTVLVQETVLPAKLRSGDIISFTSDISPGAIITHRVVRAELQLDVVRLVTLPLGKDAEERLWLVNPVQPVGRVVFPVPLVGYVLRSIEGPIVVAGLMLLGLAVLWARSRSAPGRE